MFGMNVIDRSNNYEIKIFFDQFIYRCNNCGLGKFSMRNAASIKRASADCGDIKTCRYEVWGMKVTTRKTVSNKADPQI